MIINRDNYEEFFILYMDNELNGEERLQVELFAQNNPDLQEELNILLQSKLVPDNIVFDGKEELLRFDVTTDISLSNYEGWLLLYIDNELTSSQKQTVDQFVAGHPSVKKELDILQLAKLQPEENIIFPYKDSLYRETAEKEPNRRGVFSIRWQRIAVAAAILFAVSTGAFLLTKQPGDTGAQPGIASGKSDAAATPQTVNSGSTQGIGEASRSSLASNEEKNNIGVPETRPEKTTINDAHTNVASQHKKPVQDKFIATPVMEDQRQIANVTDPETTGGNRNNLPQPKNNPNVMGNNEVVDNNVIAKNVVVKPVLTNPKENIAAPAVTEAQSHPLDPTYASTQAAERTEIDATQSGKKNKLRGFFRKVTRTFEKTTNIKATDDEDRLLVAGLAIKL